MKFTAAEVAKHNTPASCWVKVHGQVYDVTEFLPEHPGGASAVVRYAGHDATDEYDRIHPPGTIEKQLPPEEHLGKLLLSSEKTPDDSRSWESPGPIPDPAQIIVLNDFEEAAKRKLQGGAWIYFSSGAESMRSCDSNISDWCKVTFRPRVLRDVRKFDMRRTVFGHRSGLPIFIARCALVRLGHPDGELCLARGVAPFDIPYAVSMGSSIDANDLIDCLQQESRGGCLVFQLYAKKDADEVRSIVRRAKALGFRSLMVTVDTPVIGKRTEDDRFKARKGFVPVAAPGVSTPDTTIPRNPYSASLNWNDLAWIVQAWGDAGPVCLKGLPTVDDVRHAAYLGFTWLYLSNHGGRQLDGAPSGLHVLMEIRRFYPEVLHHCEILLDGGVRRGTDVLKALALGASAVGIGRPFMYALSTHGTDGVCRALENEFYFLLSLSHVLAVTSSGAAGENL